MRASPLPRTCLFVLCLLVLGPLGLRSAAVHSEDLSSSALGRLSADLQYLSSDSLGGRDVGSSGIDMAAEFISQRFQQLGLETDIFGGSPYQEFTIPGPPELGPAEHNRLHFSGPAELPPLVLGEHYLPLALGNSGTFSGPVVFAGYGITAPELNYDDYENLDVAGKVVIVLRKEPNQNDPQSKFDGVRSSQHAYFSTKELNANLHRAAALIIVNDRLTVAAAGGDALPEVSGAGSPVSDRQLPTLYCLRSVVDELLKTRGTSLDALEAAIDSQTQPHSLGLDGIQAQGQTEVVQSQIPVRNVIGLLPGRGELAEQYIVVGAHYDHVGMGGAGSLAPGTIEIHNGADDNASGSSALLEVARRLASPAGDQRRSIVFIAFTAEERGLLGSKHYIRHPRWPLEQTVAMLNMDMVGRMQENFLTVYGTGTAEGFDDLVDRLGQAAGLAIEQQAAGFGPSDHSSFYEVGIPVLHFFTGLHNDYHRPSDDFEKANLQGMLRIADVVAAITAELATLRQPPNPLKNSAVAQIGPARSSRPRLGVRLEQRDDSGPQIAEVLPDSPAQAAGLQSGDVIRSLAEQPVASVGDLQQLLRQQKPGDTISLQVQRGDQSLTITVKLHGG